MQFEGELYILATDQGYINQPDLVWEKLNEVRFPYLNEDNSLHLAILFAACARITKCNMVMKYRSRETGLLTK